jgi:hypothetical protein
MSTHRSSMSHSSNNQFYVSSGYQPLVRQVGLDAEAIFNDARILPWRKLPDRENCTIDVDLPTGIHLRWHVKRYFASPDSEAPVQNEVAGHRALIGANIPSAPLVGYGTLSDGRSFVLFDDLTGYKPADKLIERGVPFERLLAATADLAARLHNANLHHRDLYLCHFMAREIGETVDLKLIDTARVKSLPGVLTRGRWINKDLAQFWYSTLRLPITDQQRTQWLSRYCELRKLEKVNAIRRRIERKVRAISRHDERLHRDRPERDVSIPD